jgi:cysteinyl-tRNA synthetase
MSSSNKGKKGAAKPMKGSEPKPVVQIDTKTAVPVAVDAHTTRIINVRKVMKERDKCRLETEDFAKSDTLRERLKDMGVEVVGTNHTFVLYLSCFRTFSSSILMILYF